MLNNSKLSTDQLNKYVKGYHFLSPRLKSECFSSFSQRPNCMLSQCYKSELRHVCESSSSRSTSMISRMFTAFRATCEANASFPLATERMERAKDSLKQTGTAHSSIVSDVEIQNYLANETGKDRLIKMFSKNHLGESSPEVKFIYQVTVQSAAVTFLIMTTLAGRQAKQDFIERNRATVFNTRFQAFRRLHDAIFLFSMKEGMKWAFKVSIFTLSFLGISHSIAVYRNKSSVWEYSIGAGITAGLLKCNLGLRAFVVGTGFGAVMGLMMGFPALGTMKAFNDTQEQRHYWQIQKELETEKRLENKGQFPVRENA